MDKNPDAFRTISEAAEELDLPQHVLRFWETRFSQIRPMKRSGGRRYYRTQDVELLSAIRHLLYGEGYTIKGVQRILKQQGTRAVVELVTQLGQSDGGAAGLAGLAQSAVAGDAPPQHEPLQVQPPQAASQAPLQDQSTWQDHSAPQEHASGAAGEAVHAGGFYENQSGGQLSGSDIGALKRVLADLVECRRVLDAAQAGH